MLGLFLSFLSFSKRSRTLGLRSRLKSTHIEEHRYLDFTLLLRFVFYNSSEMEKYYREDLAYIHDVGFGHFAENAASMLVKLLQKQRKNRGFIVDLGCGSGIAIAKLHAAGYDSLGVDISTDLIAIARQRIPTANFQIGSFFTVSIPDCDAVIAIGECFNYLCDLNNEKSQLWQLFQRIYNALSLGGFFLFDVAIPGRIPGSGSLKTHTENEDWTVLMTAEENRESKILIRWITTFRKIGELYRRDREIHQLYLYDRKELLEQLQTIGFQVQEIEGYGELKFLPGHIGILAQK